MHILQAEALVERADGARAAVFPVLMLAGEFLIDEFQAADIFKCCLPAALDRKQGIEAAVKQQDGDQDRRERLRQQHQLRPEDGRDKDHDNGFAHGAGKGRGDAGADLVTGKPADGGADAALQAPGLGGGGEVFEALQGLDQQFVELAFFRCALAREFAHVAAQVAKER